MWTITEEQASKVSDNLRAIFEYKMHKKIHEQVYQIMVERYQHLSKPMLRERIIDRTNEALTHFEDVEPIFDFVREHIEDEIRSGYWKK